MCVCDSCSVMSDSLQPHGLQPAWFLCPWDFPGRNTGVGCHSLLQGIFLTQGLNPGLLHCRWTFYHLSHTSNTICTRSVIFNIKLFFKCPISVSQGRPEELLDWGYKENNLLQRYMNVNFLVLTSTLGENWVKGT